MAKSWVVRESVLLLLMTGFGVCAVLGAPDGGHALGIWPVGAATATFMVAARPATPILATLIGGLAVLSIWLGGRDLGVAIGLGAGLAVEAWLVWRILSGGRRERPSLRTTTDLARLLGAAAGGALVVAAFAVDTSAVTGWGDPLVLALAVGTSSLMSQLVLIPFFSRLRNPAPVAPVAERVAQWVLLVIISAAVFWPHEVPSIAFVVIPVLVWTSLRSSAYEAMAALVAVLAFAIPLTTWGRGPFATAGARFGVSVDAQGILLSTYGLVCALVVLTLTVVVGEQRENARQTVAERDRVQSIVGGTTGVAIIGTDERGLITLFNPGAQRLLGYAAEEVLGRDTRMLHSDAAITAKARELGVPDDFVAVARALMGRGAAEIGFVRKDGQERMHSMSLNRVEDDRGEVIGYVSTSEDITERLEAEARLVETLAAEREAVERLREVDQVKDSFVSSVSHELRTPITSILGYTELLEDGVYGELVPEQLDAVRRVSSNSTRLLTLIDDLLTLSRVQEDGITYLHRVFDLRGVVSAGCGVVTPTAERRSLTLDVDLPDEPIPFLGDRDLLERVVINLVGNAVKFTPDGGRVGVALTTEPGIALLRVSDTGIGIPHQEQERLFSRFFRSSLAQAHAIQGSGLGLSIALAIVEKHGGTIGVESEPGEGTVFTVRLPMVTAG